MMKRLRPLLILAGVAVVLGVLLWALVAFVLPKDPLGAEKGNAVILLTQKLDEADSVEIKNDYGQYMLVKKAKDEYYIKGKDDLKIKSNRVVSLLNDIGNLTATKKVIDSPSAEQLESYGLATPRGTVKVVNDAETYEIKFGTTTSTGNYYMQLSGDKAVYLVGSSIPDVVLVDRFQFYNHTLITFAGTNPELEKLTDIIIGGKDRDEDIVVKMNVLEDDEVGTSYMMTAPLYHSFSGNMQTEINTLMTTLPNCAVVDDSTDAVTLKKYGLDNPSYTLTYVLDGKKVEVHFGKLNETGDYRYCYVPGDKVIHYVEDTYTACLAQPLKNYCENMIYTRAADELSHITISGKGKTYEIAIGNKDSEGNFYVTINNKQVDSELFSDFYMHVLTVGITDLGQIGEDKNAYVTVTFTLKDGTKETMKFYKVSDLKCFLELNGAGTFWVKTYNVEKILENAQKLYDGDVISLEWF